MSEEKKRVPTWGEIFEVEQAIKSLSQAEGALMGVASIVEADSDMSTALDDACGTAVDAARTLRAWLHEERPRRESEDLERKKAGLE